MHEVLGKTIVEADAGFRRATNTINPEDLRAWALLLIQSNTSDKEATESLPDYIQNLYPEPPDVVVVETSVTLIWGGGFFHWGFFVGNTNETMPFISDNPQYPYNFEWKPGIYYSRETKRKLL